MSVPRRWLLLALGLLTAVFALRCDPAVEVAVTPQEPGAEERDGLPPRRVPPVPVVDAGDVPREDRFRLPDGTWARALNGAKNVAPLAWPTDRPYAPIVERFVDAFGFERYRHADGSECLTVPQWRPDLGRMDSNTVLFHPTGSFPLETGAAGAAVGGARR